MDKAKENNHHWVVGLLLDHSFSKRKCQFCVELLIGIFSFCTLVGCIEWGSLGLGRLNPYWLYKSFHLQHPDFPYTPENDLDGDKLQQEFKGRLQSLVTSESIENMLPHSWTEFGNLGGSVDRELSIDDYSDDSTLSLSTSRGASELNEARLDISTEASNIGSIADLSFKNTLSYSMDVGEDFSAVTGRHVTI